MAVKTRNLENLSSVSGCTLKICRHRVSHTKMALSIEFCQAAEVEADRKRASVRGSEGARERGSKRKGNTHMDPNRDKRQVKRKGGSGRGRGKDKQTGRVLAAAQG